MITDYYRELVARYDDYVDQYNKVIRDSTYTKRKEKEKLGGKETLSETEKRRIRRVNNNEGFVKSIKIIESVETRRSYGKFKTELRQRINDLKTQTTSKIPKQNVKQGLKDLYKDKQQQYKARYKEAEKFTLDPSIFINSVKKKPKFDEMTERQLNKMAFGRGKVSKIFEPYEQMDAQFRLNYFKAIETNIGVDMAEQIYKDTEHLTDSEFFFFISSKGTADDIYLSVLYDKNRSQKESWYPNFKSELANFDKLRESGILED